MHPASDNAQKKKKNVLILNLFHSGLMFTTAS